MISPKYLAEMIKANQAKQAGSTTSVTRLEQPQTSATTRRAA